MSSFKSGRNAVEEALCGKEHLPGNTFKGRVGHWGSSRGRRSEGQNQIVGFLRERGEHDLEVGDDGRETKL